jgi:hypothetical protein
MLDMVARLERDGIGGVDALLEDPVILGPEVVEVIDLVWVVFKIFGTVGSGLAFHCGLVSSSV